ncbi:MAG TPA: hypothetical protein VMP89_05965 [Solirubrobacteraceae bacterium]|nr:hypothetical protein [Solirubrobacteraceae bacterium]
MNVVAGLYIGAWMLIWLSIAKVVELMWPGSATSQSLGTITS